MWCRHKTLLWKLDRITFLLGEILEKEDKIMVDMEKLAAAVARNDEVDASVVTLVNKLAEEIRSLSQSATDVAALQAELNTMADRLTASSDTVAAAVVANTPVDPVHTAQ
jgi:hypothetical protein